MYEDSKLVHTTTTPMSHQLLSKVVQKTIDFEIIFNDVCVPRAVFYETSDAHEIPMYHIEMPNANNAQLVKVVYDDFDVEMTDTSGLKQQFEMEVTDQTAEVFPHDYTFGYLSTSADMQLGSIGKLDSDDNLTPDSIFLSGDVWAVTEFTTTRRQAWRSLEEAY